jgi:hypothetical protein
MARASLWCVLLEATHELNLNYRKVMTWMQQNRGPSSLSFGGFMDQITSACGNTQDVRVPIYYCFVSWATIYYRRASIIWGSCQGVMLSKQPAKEWPLEARPASVVLTQLVETHFQSYYNPWIESEWRSRRPWRHKQQHLNWGILSSSERLYKSSFGIKIANAVVSELEAQKKILYKCWGLFVALRCVLVKIQAQPLARHDQLQSY